MVDTLPAPPVLADESAAAKVLVKAAPDGPAAAAMGVGFGAVRDLGGGRLAVGSGVGEWLLLGPPGTVAVLRACGPADRGDELVTVLDATAGRTVLGIAGGAGAAVLAKVCAVDLGKAADGTAVRTAVASVPCLVVRTGAAFLVVCERSYGRYLTGALLDAGGEFAMVAAQDIFPAHSAQERVEDPT